MLRRASFLSVLVTAGLLHAARSPQGPAGEPMVLGSPFGDHMVLQQRTESAIWGWVEPGTRVTVRGSWSDRVAEATANDAGRFEAMLPTPAGGGPFEVTVRAGEHERVLRDVLVGEVWICSGQSNMEWPLSSSDDGAAAIAAANHPALRLFNVDRAVAPAPQSRCSGEWQPCSPETVGSFSAVAYYFAVELQDVLGVPIGLIGSNWGGTPCAAWTSLDSLERRGDMDGALAELRALAGEPEVDLDQACAEWWQALASADRALHGDDILDVDLPLEGLDNQKVPGLWADDLASFDGVVHCLRTVEVPEAWQGQNLILRLGAIDDMDTVYWNGVRIDGREEPGHWNRERRYEVPAAMVRGGAARLVVRIVDTGGEGGVTGAADAISIGPDGASPLPLAGSWRRRVGPAMGDLKKFPSRDKVSPRQPSSLFNGMIAPLVPLTVAGFIWYQGESDRDQAWRYRTLFPEMIEDWRTHFRQPELPFYLVQIAPYDYGGDSGQAAELREAQAWAQVLPNVGMAVTMDIGDPDDIHPVWKEPVGQRLAALALGGRSDSLGSTGGEGPRWLGLRQEGSTLRLYFDFASDLELRGDADGLFEIAGEDRVFHPGRPRIEGRTVVVDSDAVAAPVAVRYAWGAAAKGALFNGAGLPASSFRTDAWRGVTERR